MYVADAVLGAYEGKAEFQVFPESGAISFGNQWGVGNSDRIGRDLIRLELGKLYEGAPPSVIQHWHRFAVTPPRALLQAGAAPVRNIADRARDITLSLVELGEWLNELAGILGVTDTSPENFVRLNRGDLRYRGWWTPEMVKPITRHVPLDLQIDDFLDRCVDLNNLIVEGLGERDLRQIVRAVGVPADETKGLRALKLLDMVTRLAQVSHATGLSFSDEAAAIWGRLKDEGTQPERPLEYLFALYDMRIIASHGVGERQQKLAASLERFGIEPGSVAGGYGQALDTIYDLLGQQLADLCGKIAAALRGADRRADFRSPGNRREFCAW